jgi:hypothetical protein
MKTLPYVAVYVPWVAMIACEIALFVLLWKQPGRTRFRGFELFVTSSLSVSLVLMGISLFGTNAQYFYAYYLGAFLKASALVVTVLEQYRIQFFPRWSMSDRAFNLFIGLLSAVVAGSIGMMAFTPQKNPLWDLALARRIVSLSDYLLCGSMGLLLLYGEFLKVERPQRAHAIVRGLIATGILSVTASLMLSVSGTASLGGVVGFSTTTGFVAVLISWIVAFRKPEPAPELDGTQESPLDGMAGMPSHAVVSQVLMWKM